MNWQSRLYMGTWQFGGDFANHSEKTVVELIRFAWSVGIRCFDTAAVYGNGSVEKMLGNTLPREAFILSKIPARKKPNLSIFESSVSLYPEDWVLAQTADILKRLGRDSFGTLLLHNWRSEWGHGCELLPISFLNKLKESGVIGKLGISLPDGYGSRLSDELLEHIDVIETPYNCCERWIFDDLGRLRQKGIEVIMRSIFLQGMLLKTEEEISGLRDLDIRRKKYRSSSVLNQVSSSELLRSTWQLGTSIVIGMTSSSQIANNVESVRNLDSDE